MNPELTRLLDDLDAVTDQALGEDVHRFARDAWPICRSITGDGVRQTLRLLSDIVTPAGASLDVHEVPTGTQVFDWEVPKEWNVRGAWVAGPEGTRVVDFAEHTLHLLSYSVPFRGAMRFDELDAHLHSDPHRPDVIPYRTSYYEERWGFCLPHRLRERLRETSSQGTFTVEVDTTLEPGHLTYGEIVLPGESDESVLLSAHVCHPSLANDNLSALGVAAQVAKHLAKLSRRRLTYRILFAPGTIGAITWLARNPELFERAEGAQPAIRHALVMANLGDGGAFHYKRTRRGDAPIDRAVEAVLGAAGGSFEVEDFSPFGYDERQFCSPGVDLDAGSLTRTPWGRYPEYHSSGDDLELIRPEHLGRSLRTYLEVIHALEHDAPYRNLNPRCEPQLGRRGLYSTLGGGDEGRERQLALLWVLNQSDGTNSLVDIARRAKMSPRRIAEAATLLLDADLLEPA